MKITKTSIWTFLLTVLVLTSCDVDDINPTSKGRTCIGNNGGVTRGMGQIITETLSLEDFDKVDFMFGKRVIISQGTTQEVKVSGQANIIDKLKTEVIDGKWTITAEDGCYENYELLIEITIPNLKASKLIGSGSMIINDFSEQEDLSINITGSGDMTLNKFEGITNLDVSIQGSGDFNATQYISTLEKLDLNIAGSGSYLGYNISSEESNINIVGSGNAQITAINTLIARISGGGNISYKGSPTITQNIIGSGRLINAN